MKWYCHGCGHEIPNPPPGCSGLGLCECGAFRWASWPKDSDPIATLPPVTTHPNVPLGKDARCSYCGGALWVCRGTHSIC